VLAAGELVQQIPHVALTLDGWLWFMCGSLEADIWCQQVLD
jgi:hypothetical protein